MYNRHYLAVAGGGQHRSSGGPARWGAGPLGQHRQAVAGEQAVQVTWYDDVDWRL